MTGGSILEVTTTVSLSIILNSKYSDFQLNPVRLGALLLNSEMKPARGGFYITALSEIQVLQKKASGK